MSAFGNYALESVKALKSAARGLSLWMTKFVLEGWDQQPALMSLHEFLREGGEASFRIMNRLSHLMQNLEFSGLGSAFPFSPASRKNSWRAWDGRTEKKECILCERSVHVCTYTRNFLCLCVYLRIIYFSLKLWLEYVGHRAQRLTYSVSCGLPLPPPPLLGCFCVLMCITFCVWVHDCAA